MIYFKNFSYNSRGIFWGIFIAAFGVILLLKNLGIITEDIWKLWPVLLILLGIKILLRRISE